MNPRDFSERFPLPAAVLAITAISLATELPIAGFLLPFFGRPYADFLMGILEQSAATAIVVLIARKIGLYGTFGFTRPRPWKSVLLGWPLLAMAVLNLPDFGNPDTASIRLFSLEAFVMVLLYLSTGFIEESLFRGLVGGILGNRFGRDGRGIFRTVMATSLLFGLAHFLNLFQHRYTVLASVTQVSFAFCFGVFFHALYLRTRSLYPGIVLHCLVDTAGNLQKLIPGAPLRTETVVSKTPGEAVVSIAISLSLLLIGLFLLRKAGLKTEPAAL